MERYNSGLLWYVAVYCLPVGTVTGKEIFKNYRYTNIDKLTDRELR